MTEPRSGELEVSLRDLPRSIGSRLSRQIQWTVPEGFGTPTMGVPVGSHIPINIDLSAIDRGVLVQAVFDLEFVGECVRCLETVRRKQHVDASDIYYESPRTTSRVKQGKQADTRRGDQEVDHSDDDDPSRQIGPHDTIDLGPFLRDSIIPLVDLLPLCSQDCPGLCMICGERIADLPPDHHHDSIDPRFAQLSSLFDTPECAATADDDDRDADDHKAPTD